MVTVVVKQNPEQSGLCVPRAVASAMERLWGLPLGWCFLTFT